MYHFVCATLPTSLWLRIWHWIMYPRDIAYTHAHTLTLYNRMFYFLHDLHCCKYYPKCLAITVSFDGQACWWYLELDNSDVLRKDMRTIYNPAQRSFGTDLRNSHTQAAVQSMFLFLRTLKLSGGKRKDVRSGDKRNLPTPGRVSL